MLVSPQTLANSDYSTILTILILVRRLNELGFEFCQAESKILDLVLKDSALSFFNTFHAQKLEELQLFLTQEAWEPCPVRNDFDYTQLKGTNLKINLKRLIARA